MTKNHICAKEIIVFFFRKLKESRTNLNVPSNSKIAVILKKSSIIKTFPENLFKKSLIFLVFPKTSP